MKDFSQITIEELKERIAPSIAPGLQGYEGQPGNQGGHGEHGSVGQRHSGSASGCYAPA